MAGIYRDDKGRFISAEKYLNDILPASISWGDPKEIEFFESEKNKISQKYGLSFDEEENEFFKPFGVKGSLRENAELRNARDFGEALEILQGAESSFPYWELSGYINESEENKTKIFYNEKLVFQGKKDNAIEKAQDLVRDINNGIKSEKAGGKQNTYALFFPIEVNGVLEIHLMESEEIDVSEYSY